ncbi:MAG: hypothetical protein II890_03700 [Spirochaetia bacterium]|nr:hypothetical protein [Spirochaetia bacterium]
MLTEKLVKYYRQVANIFCWAFLIIATLTGAATGYDEWDSPGLIIGGLGGLFAAFMIELFIVPPIMVLFEINDKLDDIRK